MNERPKLLDLYEVAEWLGVSSRSIRNWWSDGRFPAPMRLGARLRWSEKQIIDFLEQASTEAQRQTEALAESN